LTKRDANEVNAEKVEEIAAKLRKAQDINSYEFIYQEQVEKRLRWYDANKEKVLLQGSDVRKAYTLLLIKYLQLRSDEVPIAYEDERKIVWRSYNFCSMLEACKKLGMDTRDVCKAGEKAVEALITKVNPNLRFSRNYEKIRPYTDYCEEMIENLS
jgi:hypothetical protein